jgi:type IV fimbrial biogenesis protein FimT
MMYRNHQRGFTLAELLVSIAVASIVLTIAAPNFEGMALNNRQVGAVNELVGLFHVARSEAVTRNRQITLCPSSDGASCTATPWQSGSPRRGHLLQKVDRPTRR